MAEQDTLVTQDPETTEAQEQETTEGALSDEAEKQQEQKDWRDIFGESKKHPILQKYKTPEEFLKGVDNLQKLLGREKIPLPPQNAKEEDWEIVWEKLGRPKTADEYELPTFEDIPQEIIPKGEILKEFKQTAHKLGLLPNQVKKLYEWYVNNLKSQYAHFTDFTKKQQEEAIRKLRKDWGLAYDEKLALANKVFNQIADEEIYDLFDKGLGNDPRIIRIFARIGEMISEDELAGKPKHLTMTPDEALAEINKIKNDLNHPYYNERHPEHEAAVERMKMLFQMAYP